MQCYKLLKRLLFPQTGLDCTEVHVVVLLLSTCIRLLAELNTHACMQTHTHTHAHTHTITYAYACNRVQLLLLLLLKSVPASSLRASEVPCR